MSSRHRTKFCGDDYSINSFKSPSTKNLTHEIRKPILYNYADASFIFMR
jgi:hypothetical protein